MRVPFTHGLPIITVVFASTRSGNSHSDSTILLCAVRAPATLGCSIACGESGPRLRSGTKGAKETGDWTSAGYNRELSIVDIY